MIQAMLIIGSVFLQPIMSISPPKIKPPKNLTIKKANIPNIFKHCPKFEEEYTMPQSIYMIGVKYNLLRFKNCLNLKDMLVVVWSGEAREIHKTFANLIVLH